MKEKKYAILTRHNYIISVNMDTPSRTRYQQARSIFRFIVNVATATACVLQG